MNFCDILVIAVDISYNINRQMKLIYPIGKTKAPEDATLWGFDLKQVCLKRFECKRFSVTHD